MADSLMKGQVVDGFRFKGGNPGEQASWEPVAAAPDPTQGFTTTLRPFGLDTGIPLPESVSVGLAGAGNRIKDIFTLGLAKGDHDDALMARPAAQVGGVVADVATTLLPAVRGAQALQGTRAMTALGPVRGALASNAAVSAGIEGATRPGDLGDRAVNAAQGGAFSLGGELATRGAARMIGGPLSATSVTPQARALMDEGVPVPPWKASDSPRVRDFGERAKASMIGKPILAGPERRAMTSWNANLAANATPPQPVLDEAGNVLRWQSAPVRDVSDDTLNTLRGRFKESYDALYKGRVIPIDDAYRGEVSAALTAAERYYPSVAGDVKGIASKVDDLLAGVNAGIATDLSRNFPSTVKTQGHAGVTPGAIGDALDTVQDAITSAYKQGNGEKAEALEGLASALSGVRDRGLPPEVQAQAGDIKKAYTNFMQLQRAHSMMDAQKAGMVTPRHMLSSMKALDRSPGKAAFARGNVPNQSGVLNAERVLGSTLPEVGPGTAEKMLPYIAFGSPLVMGADLGMAAGAGLLASPVGNRYLMGQLPLQGALSGGVRKAAPYAGQLTRGALMSDE